MKNPKIKRTIKSILGVSLSLILAVVAGFFAGNLISSDLFPNNAYANLNGDDLRDNVSTISTVGKKPSDFDSAISFQIAEEKLMQSTKYTVIGEGTIETSAGVSQTSYSEDIRDGDSFYFGLTTYSSIVKASKEAHYSLGGDIVVNEGTPKDSGLDNVSWNDSKTYTWEEYKEAYGRYANRNCNYIVSTKTVVEDTGFSMDNGLYKCYVELDPILGGSNYIRQVGTNMGVDYKQVIFNRIYLTFWLDESFKFVKIEKFESFTVPYAGIHLTLNSTITTNFDIS